MTTTFPSEALTHGTDRALMITDAHGRIRPAHGNAPLSKFPYTSLTTDNQTL